MGRSRDIEELPACLRIHTSDASQVPTDSCFWSLSGASSKGHTAVPTRTGLSPQHESRGLATLTTSMVPIPFFLYPKRKQKPQGTSYHMLEAPGGLEEALQTQEAPLAPSMPSTANRKTNSPSSFQDSRGGQVECSGVLPADQAGPEEGTTPTVHRGKGN